MVNFFRIADKGSIRKPTMMGLMVFFAYMIIIMALLRESIVLAIILLGLGYVIITSIFAQPLRHTLSRALLGLREHRMTSLPRVSDNTWVRTNKEVLARVNIKVFSGVAKPADKEKGKSS